MANNLLEIHFGKKRGRKKGSITDNYYVKIPINALIYLIEISNYIDETKTLIKNKQNAIQKEKIKKVKLKRLK